MVNAAASSVAVTVKLFAAPRSRIAWMPAGDRVVPEAGGLGEHQHVVRRRRRRRPGMRRAWEHGGEGEQRPRRGRSRSLRMVPPVRRGRRAPGECAGAGLVRSGQGPLLVGRAAMQVHRCTTVPSAELLPDTSRHLPDCGLRSVPSDCGAQFWRRRRCRSTAGSSCRRRCRRRRRPGTCRAPAASDRSTVQVCARVAVARVAAGSACRRRCPRRARPGTCRPGP